MKKELKQTIELFLSSNNISYNKEELHLQLLTHPFFPSINAITDLFDHFKIENIAAELPREVSIISELPSTFLAHINEERSEKIVLVIKKENQLKLIYDSKQKKEITYEDFVALWTGVIVAVERDENNIQKKLPKLTSLFRIASYVSLSLLIVLAFVLNPFNIVGLNYLLITIIGIYTCVLLVQKELGMHSKRLDKFCEASESSSCEDVLNSKGALVFGIFKLSDVGIVYFSGIFLSILIFSFSSLKITNQIFFYLSALPLLFIPYSIYYQWRVIKKWCPLCLIVIGVLLIQGVIALFFIDLPFLFNGTEILVVLFSFFSLSIIWVELKTGYINKNEFNVLQLEHYKFKRNFSLFKTALKSSKQKNIIINDVDEIILGNINAPLKIVLVTNPRCFFCKEVHHVYHQLLKGREKDIQLIIRFNINTSTTEGNIGLEISNQLIDIYVNLGEQKCMEALDEIYSDVDTEKWLNKWKSTTHFNYLTILEKEREWCINNGISFTPAILIDGYLFPKEYDKNDITFFLDTIIEEGL
jgi:uncharacterized membrane protein